MGYDFVINNSMIKNVLITGSNGYLGNKIYLKLKKKIGVKVVTLSRKKSDYICNLTKLNETKKILKSISPDLIIHCAASVPKKINEYNEDFTSNELMVENLLNSSICPIVFISSMTVYGDGIGIKNPVAESSLLNPGSHYAVSKLISEKLIEESGRDSLIVRIPGLFGIPRVNGIVANMAYSFKHNKIPKMPDKPILWSSMHVSDAVDIITKLCFSKWHGLIKVNVGYREKCSVRRVFEILNKKYNRNFVYKIKHPDFQPDLTICDSLIGSTKYNLMDAINKFGDELSNI